MSHSCGSGSTGSSVKLCAEILRHLQRADLDADPQPVAVEHDVLDVADARRRREGPLLDRLGVAERLQLAPGLALVLADVEMRRQRAGEHHVAALQFAGAARPELVMRQAVVDPGPLDAAVVAARHADAARRGEQRAVVERGDAADEHALQGAMLDGPAALGFRQQRDAVHRADQDGVGGRLRPLDVGSAVGEQDHGSLRSSAATCAPRPSGGPAARSRSPGRCRGSRSPASCRCT